MVEIKFEEALAKLEKIVEKLESGELSLEESIAKYEEGMKLSGACSQKLEAAKQRIEILVKSDKTKVTLKPFSAKEEEGLGEGAKKTKRDKVKKEEGEEGFLF